MISVLFVCMGNICRSPAGEAIFRHKITKPPRQLDHLAALNYVASHVGAIAIADGDLLTPASGLRILKIDR